MIIADGIKLLILIAGCIGGWWILYVAARVHGQVQRRKSDEGWKKINSSKTPKLYLVKNKTKEGH